MIRTFGWLSLGAALLPPLALAAAGHTSFASYLGQVPAPPRDAQQAYGFVIVHQEPYGEPRIEQPKAFTSLGEKLEAETRLAASEGGGGVPMGIPDEASARALQQQMANMTPAQQMAMAQQMSAQMNAATQTGAMGPGDQAVTELLGQRQEGSMTRMQAATQLMQEWSAMKQRWEAKHNALLAEESKVLDRTPNQCSKTDDMDFAALKVHEQYAARQLDLVRDDLKESRGLFDRQRVLAVDDAGFADQLTPKMKTAKSLLSRQGYTAARNDAVQQIGRLNGFSWELYEHAARWWAFKLDTRQARRCAGAG